MLIEPESRRFAPLKSASDSEAGLRPQGRRTLEILKVTPASQRSDAQTCDICTVVLRQIVERSDLPRSDQLRSTSERMRLTMKSSRYSVKGYSRRASVSAGSFADRGDPFGMAVDQHPSATSTAQRRNARYIVCVFGKVSRVADRGSAMQDIGTIQFETPEASSPAWKLADLITFSMRSRQSIADSTRQLTQHRRVEP